MDPTSILRKLGTYFSNKCTNLVREVGDMITSKFSEDVQWFCDSVEKICFVVPSPSQKFPTQFFNKNIRQTSRMVEISRMVEQQQ